MYCFLYSFIIFVNKDVLLCCPEISGPVPFINRRVKTPAALQRRSQLWTCQKKLRTLKQHISVTALKVKACLQQCTLCSCCTTPNWGGGVDSIQGSLNRFAQWRWYKGGKEVCGGPERHFPAASLCEQFCRHLRAAALLKSTWACCYVSKIEDLVQGSILCMSPTFHTRHS